MQMKSLTNFNRGVHQAWTLSKVTLHSLIIGGVLILMGIQAPLQAQEVHFTKPSWYFGVAGGANLNFYRGTTQRLNSDIKVTSAFHDGSGVGLYVAPLIEFHRPDTKFGFILQAGYDSRKGKFTEVMTPCNCPADLRTDLSYITVEPSLRFAPFRSNFYLFAGPRFAFNLAKSFTYSQGTNPAFPLQVAPADMTGNFNNLKKNLISMQIGAGYDFPLSMKDKQTQFVVSPFISFHPYFGQEPRSIESWNVTTVRAGVAFKFGHGHKIAALVAEEAKAEVKQEVKPEIKPEATTEEKPEIKPEEKPEAMAETKTEPVPVVKTKVVGNVFKIYFAFNKWNIDISSASELDRLAAHMKENPAVKVDINSFTDSRGSENYNMQLSEKRGKSVADYLASKGISASRFKTNAFGETQLVNKCTDDVQCSEAEHAVNRRTEINVFE